MSETNGQLLPAKRSYNPLRLNEAAEMAPPPAGIGAWAEKLRQAAYDAVKEGDVQDLIRVQMEKAKAGDLKAAQFVLDFLTGGAPKVHLQKVVVYKESRTVQRHSKPRPEAVEDRALPAEPAMIAPPPVKVLRRLAAKILAAEGPTPAPAIAGQLEVEADHLPRILECDWFKLTGGKWALTPEGRQANG